MPWGSRGPWGFLYSETATQMVEPKKLQPEKFFWKLLKGGASWVTELVFVEPQGQSVDTVFI